MRVLLAIALLLGACTAYDYNRAALVPRATPRFDSGQPLSGRGRLSLGASSLAHFGVPRAGDRAAGLEIPGTQLAGSLRVRIGEILSLGLVHERALAAGAVPLHADQPPVDGGSATGYGLTADLAVPTGDPRLHVGLGARRSRAAVTAAAAAAAAAAVCPAAAPASGGGRGGRGRGGRSLGAMISARGA